LRQAGLQLESVELGYAMQCNAMQLKVTSYFDAGYRQNQISLRLK
jgi:hypothetical protein